MRYGIMVWVGLLVVGGLRGEGTEFGDWIAPSVHFNGAVGASSAHCAEDLATGHHDPTREDGTVQGLEIGASLRMNDTLQGFATYTLHYGAEEEWEGEWEEAFLKLADLPYGFEVRGGRMLARFGVLNAVHLHGWNFVDLPLVAGRLLGEDGLILDGGDATWARYDRELTYGLTAGYGRVKTHDHGHGHEEEAEDHGEVPHAHEDEAHGGWHDNAAYGRLFAIWRKNDFHQWTTGLSGAFGENEDHRTRSVLGLDVTYQWRENGLAAGGRALRVTTEVMTKLEKQQHDHPLHDDADDGHGAPVPHDENAAADFHRDSTFGFYSQAVYTWNDHWDSGMRVGYVESDGAVDSRLRVSPAMTWHPGGTPGVSLRVQYNYDALEDHDEHTVWAQLGLSWGGSEVR